MEDQQWLGMDKSAAGCVILLSKRIKLENDQQNPFSFQTFLSTMVKNSSSPDVVYQITVSGAALGYVFNLWLANAAYN